MEQHHSPRPKNLHYYMHTLHRWLGFFFIGMVAVYALSGIALTYRDTNFLKSEKRIEKTIEPNLTAEKLGKILQMRRFGVKEETAETITFDGGTYNRQTGAVAYTVSEYIFPMDKFVKLHKTSAQSGLHWFNLMFGVVLLFLALSSLFMFDTKTAHFRQGIILTLAGVAFTVLVLMFL